MSPQSAIRVRVAAAGQDGAAGQAAEESLVGGGRRCGLRSPAAVVSSSGGVKDSWASARPRTRRSNSPADASRSMSTTPSARSWKFPVSKMKHYLTWWANSMQSRCNTLQALGMLRDRPADHEKAVREAPGAVEGVARVLAERRTSAPTLRSCLLAQPTGKKPAASLKALYGCASNTPGARNGRYTDPMLEGQVGNLRGTSKQQLRIRSVLDVPADTSPRPLRPLRQLLPQRAWDGDLGRRRIRRIRDPGRTASPDGGLTAARSARSATVSDRRSGNRRQHRARGSPPCPARIVLSPVGCLAHH